MLESFGLVAAEPREPELGADGGSVLEHVREGAAGADELARVTGLAAGELAAALTELELAGAVTEEEVSIAPLASIAAWPTPMVSEPAVALTELALAGAVLEEVSIALLAAGVER